MSSAGITNAGFASTPSQPITVVAQTISNLQDHERAIRRMTSRIISLSEQILGPEATQLNKPTFPDALPPPSINLFQMVERLGTALNEQEVALNRFFNN